MTCLENSMSYPHRVSGRISIAFIEIVNSIRLREIKHDVALR